MNAMFVGKNRDEKRHPVSITVTGIPLFLMFFVDY